METTEKKFNEEDYDKYGHDKNGIHKDTGTKYDPDGYDAEGYDEDGYDADGYDEDGYDKDGLDEDGYDRDGYDEEGWTREDNEAEEKFIEEILDGERLITPGIWLSNIIVYVYKTEKGEYWLLKVDDQELDNGGVRAYGYKEITKKDVEEIRRKTRKYNYGERDFAEFMIEYFDDK